jgi:hypothetical protein
VRAPLQQARGRSVLFADPYDRLSECSSRECILGSEDNRKPFGILANRSRYFFQSVDLPSSGYEGGYFQFFPVSDEIKGREQVARLKRDRWMGLDAQWARLDFQLFNCNESLFVDFHMFLEIDPSGRVFSDFLLLCFWIFSGRHGMTAPKLNFLLSLSGECKYTILSKISFAAAQDIQIFRAVKCGAGA